MGKRVAGRVLVLWCPDWPAVAAGRQARIPAGTPLAVFHANRVQTCTATARAAGIRIGMRRREAQSRCPELAVLPQNHDVAARLFEPVAAAVEDIAPGLEVLRPGMLACPARGPSRYFGGEEGAAEQLTDVVEALDVEAVIGIADHLEVAVLAARQQRIVPPGQDAAFCAGLPIAELTRDSVIAPPERRELVDLLIRLGITSCGAFAALPTERVATRFGLDGVAAHRLASGLGERGLYSRSVPDDLVVQRRCDPPLNRVDTAAFLGRALAEELHARLADAGLACTRLAISAATSDGRTLHRVWRAARPLTAEATADRMRWQLDGWLTSERLRQQRSGSSAGNDDAVGNTEPDQHGITVLRLQPVEAVDAGRVQYGLWGSDGADDHRAGWAFARVQGLLGPDAVLTPVRSGGRGPADKVTMVSWGDERRPERDPDLPWPGALPAPSPSRIADPARPDKLELRDAAGVPVSMTPRGTLSADPASIAGLSGLDGAEVAAWAGPWVVDERWWDAKVPAQQLISARPRYSARMQLVPVDGPALLLRYRAGPPAQGCWLVEGRYD
ncbi:DNA polymerase Y family protein [Nakamurella aerolata]|uniref:DNA polymerase Y family protein n=1 Tax=Nakamurella aerolata TaxID=1656892 RepID=UPI0031B640DE